MVSGKLIAVFVAVLVLAGGLTYYFVWMRGGGAPPAHSASWPVGPTTATASPTPWPLSEGPNTYIERRPGVEDFVPINVTYTVAGDGLLSYMDDSAWVGRWTQSCFILVAVGWSDDGNHTFVYQGRLPFTGEGSFAPRINIDGRYLREVPVFGGGMYYRPEGIPGYPYPTVYVRGRGGFVETLSYDVEGGRWIHLIASGDGRVLLRLVGWESGAPFWMGPMNGPYIVHGAYARVRDIDVWGGFWVSGRFRAEITVPGAGRLRFHGYFLFDRAVHRSYYGNEYGPRGSVLAFSCIVIFHRDFIIMISHSDNPTPERFIPFQHQGRVNIPSMGVTETFNRFTLDSLGEDQLQPSVFHIYGPLKDGYVDLWGNVTGYWPPKGWHPLRGTWWNPDALFCWGRAFVRWRGVVKIGGKIIRVNNATGVGEFTRYTAGGALRGAGHHGAAGDTPPMATGIAVCIRWDVLMTSGEVALVGSACLCKKFISVVRHLPTGDAYWARIEARFSSTISV